MKGVVDVEVNNIEPGMVLYHRFTWLALWNEPRDKRYRRGGGYRRVGWLDPQGILVVVVYQNNETVTIRRWSRRG